MKIQIFYFLIMKIGICENQRLMRLNLGEGEFLNSNYKRILFFINQPQIGATFFA